jgi:hypothetical protein
MLPLTNSVITHKELNEITQGIEKTQKLVKKFPRLYGQLIVSSELNDTEEKFLNRFDKEIVKNSYLIDFFELYFSLKNKYFNNIILIYKMRDELYLKNYVINDFRSIWRGLFANYSKYFKTIEKDKLNESQKILDQFFLEFIENYSHICWGILGNKITNFGLQKLFFEENPISIIRLQETIFLGEFKKIHLRMVESPKSETVELFNSPRLQKKLFEIYLKSKKTFKDQYQDLFNLLKENLKIIFSRNEITRYYGPSFNINLQIELRSIGFLGMFPILSKIIPSKIKKKVIVIYAPNHKDITLILNHSFLYESKDLKQTLYHEIIHNLDQKIIHNAKKEIVELIILRAEMIATIQGMLFSKSLRSNKDEIKEAKDIWAVVSSKPISSLKEFNEIFETHYFSAHSIGMLIGFQIIVASLNLGNPKISFAKQFSLARKNREKAIKRIKIFSSLSVKNMFKYYLKKVPENARYFTDDCIKEIIKIC